METIKSSTEISYLFSHGKRLNGSSITLLVCKNTDSGDSCGRVAFVAGKKHGGAVWRNRAKRRMRAVAHEMGAPWPGYDVVFIAKPTTTIHKYSKVLQQAESLMQSYLT